MSDNTPDLRQSLETTFAKVRSEREAKEAVQLAADSIQTDNLEVLRERATRHAYHAVDQYWGHFNDIQKELAERVITPLLDTVSRLAAERDEHRAAAERAEAKLRKIEHGCETPESHNYGCSCDASSSPSPAAGDKQPETEELASRLYDALASYPTLNAISLRHAQIRQDLAEHIADALAAKGGAR